jgi:hypothetical protein
MRQGVQSGIALFTECKMLWEALIEISAVPDLDQYGSELAFARSYLNGIN